MPKLRNDVSQTEIGQISFGYLPGSPLNNGWTCAYGSLPSRFISPPNPPKTAGICIIWNRQQQPQPYAIDFSLDPINHEFVNRLRFSAKFTTEDDTIFFTEVELATYDGSKGDSRWIKHYVGSKPATPGAPNYKNEYIRWMAVKKLANGWSEFDIFLPSAVAETWGKEGWTFKRLKTIRIRGNISITPIDLIHDDGVEISAPKPQEEKKSFKRWKKVLALLLGTGGLVPLVIALIHACHPDGANKNVVNGNISGTTIIGDHATLNIN